MRELENHYRVIILGSGPAGLTAAIYAARANLNPLVIEGIQPGGQLTITTDVENYPGFPNGIMGPKLMDNFKSQAERFATKFIMDEASKVDLSNRPFIIELGKKKLTCDVLIISTGATARLLGLESERQLMGHGVSACATCDGWFFNDKEIIVIGGGDTACEEALFLTKFASKVSIIHRRDELRASKIMRKRVFENQKIEVKWDRVIIDFVGSESNILIGVNLENPHTGEKEFLECEGAFLGIGHSPNTKLFQDYLELDDSGYIITKADSTQTNIVGVFACGDVQDHTYRQAITAAGSGCMAGIEAERFLTEEEEEK